MKYIITENRLVGLVDKYIEDSVGKLRKFPLEHINAREDDFELVDDSDGRSCTPERLLSN
jgi:hypothetical protein